MQIVSPGVYTSELDFSLYVPALSTSIFGIVTTASKGPLNTRTLITDEGTLVATFGTPSVLDANGDIAVSHQGLYAAQRYLREGRQLWVVRVGSYGVATAEMATPIQNAAGLATSLTVALNAEFGPGILGDNVSVVVAAGTIAGYRISVLDNGYTAEVYDNVLLGTANLAAANYVVTRINATSNYITVTDTVTQTTLATGTYVFTGGADGAPADDSDIIGSVGAPPGVPATGLQMYANPEEFDVNLVAVPGNNERTVVAALITLCETRGDCMCLLETPTDMTVERAVAWHNGTNTDDTDGTYPDAALNSSYAALYYPWVTVYDSGIDTNVEISPVGHAAATIAKTDYVADPWWAPAGFNRALLRDALSIEHSPTQGERDYMYGNGNAVNPLVNFAGQGITIWGQRTLQRTPTALDRINVRRLLLYLRKVIASAVRYLVFEPNDETTWDRFINLVTPFMDDIKARRGVTDFRVICDSTTNTPAVIARNEMKGRILLQPTRAAEMVICEFVLLPTGASFSEFEA